MILLCRVMSVVQGMISYQNEPKYYHHAPNDIANINPEVTLKKKEIVNNNNKKIHFLICGSCFWCASHFNNIGDMIVKCPSCRSNNKVESIPVSYDEVYKFDYDPKRGVVLEFSKVDEGRRRS
jgi:hypothetical protein